MIMHDDGDHDHSDHDHGDHNGAEDDDYEVFWADWC